MSRPPVRTSDALLTAHERRIGLLERRILTSPSGLPDRLLADATDLGAQNLNDVIASGWYVQGANANATAARNYPALRAGYLEVVGSTAGSDFVMQRYTDYQANRFADRNVWIRTYYSGVWYEWRRMDTGQASGPAANKWSNPAYFDMYFETDTGFMMVGNKSGGWRRYSGAVSDTAKAWAVTSGTSPAVMFAGRSIDFTIPTVLETRETLQITMDPALVTSGYNFIGATTLIRNPTNTTVTVRLMQLNSFTTQPIQIVWKIVPF